jgi:hypothetical protein
VGGRWVGEGVVVREAEGVVCVAGLCCGRGVERWVQIHVCRVVEIIVVGGAFVVVFVVVPVVLRTADIVDVYFLSIVLLPIPFIAPVFAIRWVKPQIRERDPVQFDLLQPFKPLSARPVLL